MNAQGSGAVLPRHASLAHVFPMHSLPFSATSSLWDEFEVDGVIRADATALVIEYEGSWTRSEDGTRASGLTEWQSTRLELAYRDIVSITLDRTWVRTSFIAVRAASAGAFNGFPLAKGTVAEIPVARRYRAEASDLVSDVAVRVAEAARSEKDAAESPVERAPAAVAATGRGPLD
jgi:hypothetical protein